MIPLDLTLAIFATPTGRRLVLRPDHGATTVSELVDGILRTFDAPVELIWRAPADPEIVKQWATGSTDHSLPVCGIDLRVGGNGRNGCNGWRQPHFEMGMSAEFKEGGTAFTMHIEDSPLITIDYARKE